MMEEKKSQEQQPRSGMMMARSPRDAMGPMIVDQTLRQAIMHCWMMLADDQRTPENVTREMTRLLNRALKDLREDAASFGFPSE